MSETDTPPQTLELLYERDANGGWTGLCPAFPDLRAHGRSIHQVNLQLAPLVTQAIEARYAAPLAISVIPGGEEALADGRYRKIVPVNAAYMPCTMYMMSDPGAR